MESGILLWEDPRVRLTSSVVVLGLALMPLASCGQGSGGAGSTAPTTSTPSQVPATSLVTAAAPAVYEVGVDVPAGVWTGSPACVGIAASSREYDLMSDTDPDAYLSSGVLVGDVNRIVLEAGQFFHAEDCPVPWTLEDAAGPTSDDPATIAGACSIIFNGPDDLLEQALTFPRPTPDDGADVLLSSIQDQLSTIVVSGQPQLDEQVGQIIDFLDAPTYYRENGELDESITRAAASIQKICSDQ